MRYNWGISRAMLGYKDGMNSGKPGVMGVDALWVFLTIQQ